jgi:hypothetical protein
VFQLIGTVTNNSDDRIDFIVLDYVISNKRLAREVLRVRMAIEIAIVKTATIDLNDVFIDMNIDSDKDKPSSLEAAKIAVEQLGADFQWSYEFIEAVPHTINEDSDSLALIAAMHHDIFLHKTRLR